MIGSQLAHYYRRAGYRVVGIARPSAAARNHAGYSEDVFPCDILERGQSEALLSRYQPDVVLHMAAQAFNGVSWETARQLARIAKGMQDPVVRVGSLTTARDFIDVRDGAAAMALIFEKGCAGEPYNVWTGHAHGIREILDLLIEISGLDIEVKADADLLRPADEPLLLGDNSKIRELGWQQRYTFPETLTDVYNDWLERSEEQTC
jgi:nucleoside-diphosphate-sugar epimerase